MKRLDLLDHIDRQLISLLQVNSRESIAELARKLSIARTTVIARIDRLEKTGIITGYTIKLGQDVLTHEINAYVGISLDPKLSKDVIKQLEKIPEISLLYAVSGEFDYVAWMRAATPEQLNILLDEIGDLKGVIKTTTSVALAKIIDRSS